MTGHWLHGSRQLCDVRQRVGTFDPTLSASAGSSDAVHLGDKDAMLTFWVTALLAHPGESDVRELYPSPTVFVLFHFLLVTHIPLTDRTCKSGFEVCICIVLFSQVLRSELYWETAFAALASASCCTVFTTTLQYIAQYINHEICFSPT